MIDKLQELRNGHLWVLAMIYKAQYSLDLPEGLRQAQLDLDKIREILRQPPLSYEQTKEFINQAEAEINTAIKQANPHRNGEG